MRARLISFPSAITIVALLLIAPCHRGNAEELPRSAVDGPSAAPMDLVDATRRIAQLAEGADYDAAIAQASQLATAMKARLGAHHADYGRILFNLADLLTAAGRHAEAVGRYHEAITIFEELDASDRKNREWPRYLIGVYERIIRAGDQPAIHTEKALAIVKRLQSQGRLDLWEKDWPAELELKLRQIAIEKLVAAGKFADALIQSERRARQELLSATDNGKSRSDVADALGEVSWIALLARRPAKALAASARALALAPDHVWLATNYAHALLFLGRSESAKAIYLRYKGEDVPNHGRWEAVIGADFAELREHGIVNRQMAEIERTLGIVNDPAVVAQRVKVLRSLGRYPDALALIERRTQALKVQYGEHSLMYAKALDSMAAYAYSWAPVSRKGEWVAAQRQAIDLFRQFLPADDPRAAEAKRRLANFYHGDRDHDAESETLLLDVLDTCDRLPSTASSAFECLRGTTAQLGRLYTEAGRDADEARLQRRAIAAAERKWGLDHPYVVPFLELFPVAHDMADLQIRDRRIDGILGQALRGEHPDVDYAARAPLFQWRFKSLVDGYEKAGQQIEAERALKFLVQKFGDRQAVVRLVDLLVDKGQVDEARTAIKTLADKLDDELPATPYGAKDLVDLYMKAARLYGDRPQAASYRQRALGVYEHLVIHSEPDEVEAARYLSALADLYIDQQRLDAAAVALSRAIQLRQNAWSTRSPQIAELRESLARVHGSEGKDAAPGSSDGVAASKGEARQCGAGELDVVSLLDHWPPRKSEMLARCSVEDWRALNDFADPRYPGWFGDPVRAEALSGIAYAYYVRQDWANALALYGRAAELLRRARRNDADPILTGAESWTRTDEPAVFYIRSAYGLAQKENARAPELAASAFAMAQQSGRSAAASALAQMSFRLAKNEPRLAELLRKRQSVVDEWRKLDKALADAVLDPPYRRDLTAEQGEWARMGAADGRIGDIDRTLAERFPDFAAFAQSPPLSIARTQELLQPDEALVLFLEAPDFRHFAVDEVFVWVVTKTDVRWQRIEHRPTLRGMPLDARVAYLRCGLDPSNWLTGSQAYERCKALGASLPGEQEGLGSFDANSAHALYQALFGQVEDLIKDKHLLIVPSSSLTQLPFYVLVTEKPEASRPGETDHAEIKWLVDRQSVAILPSVGSLEVLRRMRPTQAHRALIGFGDPLLDGRPDNPLEVRRASEARARQSCRSIAGPGVFEWPALQDLPLIGSLFRGPLADVEALRRQMPLPETTDELCAVARRLGIAASDIRLGRRMTETAVKTLSAEGRLRDYRILHFATHGLVAGDLGNAAEPALMFSPPETATGIDDGLLTASEVAQLDLDADWVLMSACNTAAGASRSAQALSGLARAFFYAGARALLVSHWAVRSQAAVAITTGTFDAQSTDPKIGRAEALRRSIRALIATGGANAHPSVWAPFILVGDGT